MADLDDKIAAKVIDAKLNSERPPDLLDLLQKNTSYQFPADPLLELLVKQKSVALPDALYEQYDVLQCRCFLGLFTEIRRAWLTIDHRLFLWNYDSVEDFQLFEDQDQVIGSVGLVKPLPGVFLDQINYLLVIATPLEIILVAVAYDKHLNSLALYRTDISASSDGVIMTSIIGTKDGRILMCGNNGRVYELQYQAEDGWFTRKCRKIELASSAYSLFVPTFFKPSGEDSIKKVAVDEQYNIVYTLTEQSNIEYFHLGQNGKEFRRLGRVTDVFHQAQRWMEGKNTYSSSYLEPRTFSLASIHTIPSDESRKVQLMAVTSSGFRLYFSFGPSSYGEVNPYAENQKLQVVFVKIPPAGRERLRIHEACYSNNILLLAHALSDDADSIVCASREKENALEMIGSDKLDGKIWSISKIPESKNTSGFLCSSDSSRTFVVLTNSAVTMYSSRKPIDFLISILESTTTNAWPVAAQVLANWYSTEQVSSMCLSIICMSNESMQVSTVALAKRLYFELGGKPTLRDDKVEPNRIDGPLGRPLAPHEFILSGRHDGLALFMARILQPIWKSAIVKEKAKSGRRVLDWTFSYTTLSDILAPLVRLNDFLTDSPSLTATTSSADLPQIGASANRFEVEAWQAEKLSMRRLHSLLKHSIEGISFLLLLMDFKFLSIRGGDEKILKTFIDESFEHLVSSARGKDDGRAIFSKFIEIKIKEGALIESVCEVARQQCPLFCAVEDVYLFKGLECLKRAKSETGMAFDDALNEAGNLFAYIIPSMQFEKLVDIVGQFKSLHDYMHPSKLLLSYANSQDPSSHGLSYYLDCCPIPDSREPYYQKRIQCYTVLKDLALSIYAEEDGGDQAFDALLGELLTTTDELFHYFVFDWLRESQWIDKLLMVRSNHLETYLGGEPVMLDKVDILWRLYVKKEQYFNSARVLYAIASTKANNLPFVKRFEYLQLAVTHAKSSNYNEDADLVREIEDKRDVGLIQMEILQSLQRTGQLSPEDPISQNLLSISDLFQHYCRPHRLHEVSLWIIHTSEHRDPQLVQQLWAKIVNEVADISEAAHSDKILILQERVKAIGLKYYPDENVFPLAYICSVLENFTLKGTPTTNSSWVIRTMKAIKVPNVVLLQIYSDLWESKIAPWNNASANKYLSEVIHSFLENWVQEESSSKQGRNRFPAKFVDEVISKMAASPNVDTESFKRLQKSILQFS
ncbi:Nup133 N terminal like-domain-containing protein [Zopfochytrium polystomum]|nr:Nup133 N terminal like-domain-containing protein [Zopfochytrium polystomum]